MPLLDHFHPPLSTRRAWDAFHSQWAGSIAAWLNRQLPERFFAEPQTQLGSRVEADVIEFDAHGSPTNGSLSNGGVALQTAAGPYAPPIPTATFPALFPDDILVEVRDQRRGQRVVGVVELISPGNKDAPDARRAFAAKAGGYLHKGIGLVVCDLVTDAHFNLHNELIELLGLGDASLMADDPSTYVASYHPTRRDSENVIDYWGWELTVGSPLPTVPFALKGFGCIGLDLEVTYTEACTRNRIL